MRTGDNASLATAKPADTAAGRLESLRADLDSVDLALLDTLRRRIECCVEIGRVKRDFSVPMMAPHRIRVVQDRAMEYAARHDMNPQFLRQLYDLVIEETCRIEDLVIGETPETSTGLAAGNAG